MSDSQNISIAQIPSGDYEGYYWYSDAQAPEIIIGKNIDPAKFTALPFVIEANFYCQAKQISIRVRNVEGQYLVTQFNLGALPEDFKTTRKTYLGHDLKGRNFILVEAWREVVDTEQMAGLKTLQPAWSAFAGFTPEKAAQ